MRDCIHIVSHPGPDRSVTIEGLREFKVFNRRYRNRRIGDFLKELQLTEGRNTGFDKMLRALKRNGSPLPEFDTNETRDYFTATFFIHPEFLATDKNWTVGSTEMSGLEADMSGLVSTKERHAAVLDYVDEHGGIATRDAVMLLGASEATVKRLFLDMVFDNELEAFGKGRSRAYRKPQ